MRGLLRHLLVRPLRHDPDGGRDVEPARGDPWLRLLGARGVAAVSMHGEAFLALTFLQGKTLIVSFSGIIFVSHND